MVTHEDVSLVTLLLRLFCCPADYSQEPGAVQAEGSAHEAGKGGTGTEQCPGPAGAEPEGTAAGQRGAPAAQDSPPGHRLTADQAHQLPAGKFRLPSSPLGIQGGQGLGEDQEGKDSGVCFLGGTRQSSLWCVCISW